MCDELVKNVIGSGVVGGAAGGGAAGGGAGRAGRAAGGGGRAAGAAVGGAAVVIDGMKFLFMRFKLVCIRKRAIANGTCKTYSTMNGVDMSKQRKFASKFSVALFKLTTKDSRCGSRPFSDLNVRNPRMIRIHILLIVQNIVIIIIIIVIVVVVDSPFARHVVGSVGI